MSAYQVHRDTIDLIVSAAIDGLGIQHSRGISLYLPEGTKPFAALGGELNEHVSLTAGGEGVHLSIGDGMADKLGRELITQNIRSVAARYNDVAAALDSQGWKGTDNPMIGYWPADYRWRRVAIGDHELATLADVLGALSCYDYQSSETGNYDQTPAGHIIDAIRGKVIHRITDTWEWTREGAEREQAERLAAWHTAGGSK